MTSSVNVQADATATRLAGTPRLDGRGDARDKQPSGRRHHIVRVHAHSAASPESVWPLVADVTTWTAWAGFREAAYEVEAVPVRHGVGAVRRFRAGPLRSRERILVFEPARLLSYDYCGTLPLANYRSDVILAPSAHGGTDIAWRAEFDARYPLTGRVLKALMAKVLGQLATRLAATAADPPVGR